MPSIDLQHLAVTYAAAIDALPIAAFLTTPGGEISYISARWSELVGTPAGEVIGAEFALLVHPDQRSSAKTRWDLARLAGQTHRDEVMLRYGDGSYRWIVSESTPIRDPQTAHIIGWFGSVIDIDERKRVDEQLRAQAEFNERLIDSSDDCIKILDLEGRLVSLSPNGQKTLRIFNMDALVNSPWIDFWHGDDRISARAAIATALRGGTGRFTGYFPVEGEPRWFDVVVTAILGADGVPDKLLGVSRDVTVARQTTEALRESEQRYRAFSEALPGMTWSAQPDGRLDFVPDRWSQARGREAGKALGDGWLDTLHPDDRAATRVRWAHALTTGEPYATEFRVAMADGTYRWNLVRAQPIRDAAGTITRWVGVNVDVDDQHRADAARDMFVSLAENSTDCIGIGDRDGAMVYLNRAGRRLVSIEPDADVKTTHVRDFFGPADRAYFDSHVRPALERDGHWTGDLRFQDFASGALIPITYNVFTLVDRTGAVNGIATLSRDRRGRDRTQAGLQLLSRTGAATLDLLDYASTLQNIARAFVPFFSSYCVIDIPHLDGRWERTVVHRDPAKQQLLRDLDEPPEDHPISHALRTGRSSRVVLADGWPDQFTERSGAARDLEVRSFITVPVTLPDGAVVGTLSAVRDTAHETGSYVDDDIPFVQEVGRRAGAAIANARLYQRERRIAVELQAASLPATLPAVAGLSLNAEYRPGSDEATIGGDWYDAFVLEDGRMAITLGDVLGHGLQAAVTMTKLRQAMQSAAMIDPDPNVMLRVADKTLRLLDPDRYATAIAAIYNTERRTLTFASAGHPAPVVRTPGGLLGDIATTGLMLGLRRGDESDLTVIQIPADSTIVLFTDGLIEATRDLAAGYHRLNQALLNDSLMSDPTPARALVNSVLGDLQASDDIAVLVLQTST